MEKKYKYGYFNEDGTEFIITNPKTPRAFDNFLWNDTIYSGVGQTGVGCIDYQIGQSEGIQLLTGIGRTCDFDVYGRDHLMSRLIYVRDQETGNFWNVNWEPVKAKYKSYQCTHGLGYSCIKSETENILSSFRIFVPKGKDPVELWTLSLKNLSDKPRNLKLFLYNQFQLSYKWGFNSYGDAFFRNASFDKERNAIVINKHPHIAPHKHLTAFVSCDRKIDGFDGSRDAFVGIYNCLNEPQAVVDGECTGSIGSNDATVGVIQLNLSLKPGEEQQINVEIGVVDDVSGINVLKEKYLNRTDDCFKELQTENKKFIEKNQYITPDKQFNRLLNNWIKQETLYGAQWCRWGWMGYRDIVQHGFGVSSFYPERTKKILQEAFAHQFKSGMALRGWNPTDTKPYSDSALWLVFTLISYIRETGDFDFLNEQIPFFDKEEGTVLSHIERALNFLEKNKGPHKLCLIKFGDWNDSLTAIGAGGKGESVWLSMAYAEALRQMKDLFSFLHSEDKVLEFSARYREIKEAVNTSAWDGDWYARCFDDNGLGVGTKDCKEGKIFLNTQSWAMISGIADDDRTKKLISSANNHLKTRIGYLLLAPTFTVPDSHIGRISYMEPGICENGTVYSHVNVWMILGLLRANKIEEAYEAFKLQAPGYLDGFENDPKQEMPPYLYANGSYGPDHKNNPFQMEYTWITGSVAWFYNVLSKEMIGIRPDFDSLIIEPKIPAAWNNISVTRYFRNRLFKINIIREKDCKSLTIWLNDKKLSGHTIPLSETMKSNDVRVCLPLTN